MGKLSQNVHKMDKNFAPNCFLYVIINASKTQILVPQLNRKFGPSERLHLSSGRIVIIHESALRPLQMATPHQRDAPSLLILVATVGKQANEFQQCHLVASLIIHDRDQPDWQFFKTNDVPPGLLH